MHMYERKIYHLLKLLNKEEQRIFSDFLVSPLFKPSPVMQEFFHLWQKKILDQTAAEQQELSPEEFLKGSDLAVSRMDKYCSRLYKKFLDFIAFRQYQIDNSRQLESVVTGLEQQAAPQKELDAQRRRLKSDIDKGGHSSVQYLRKLQFKWRAVEARVTSRQTQSVWQEDFQDLQKEVDRYYRLQKLKLILAAENSRMIYNQNETQQEDGFEDFLPEMDDETAKNLLGPLAYSYWLTVRLYRSQGGAEVFDKLFDHLQQESGEFEQQERREIFNYALNYCLRRGNKGELLYQEHAAKLYRELLENGTILKDGKLTPQEMKNIVVIQCVVGNLDWVADFLNEYKNRLQGGPNRHIIQYNRAVLAFYKKDRHCIELLKTVISHLKDDVFYQLDARIYLLKAYYQHLDSLSMEETDEMYRMYDSFRIFIDRNDKISHAHKLGYRSFLSEFRRFLKLLGESHGEPELKRLLALKQKIGSEEYMANKSWFLKTLAKYIDRY